MWHGAPVEIVQALIELGVSCTMCFVQLSSSSLDVTHVHLTGSMDEKRRRPINIARERHHQHLYEILTADHLPEVSDKVLMRVETHFHALIVQEPGDAFKTESMRFPDLGMLRDLPKVWMPIPEMYGVHFFRFVFSCGKLSLSFS